MATPEQIASILSQLVALHPADCFKPIDAANAGLGAVLRLLYPVSYTHLRAHET